MRFGDCEPRCNQKQMLEHGSHGQWTRTLSTIKDTEDIAWETTVPEDLWT